MQFYDRLIRLNDQILGIIRFSDDDQRIDPVRRAEVIERLTHILLQRIEHDLIALFKCDKFIRG